MNFVVFWNDSYLASSFIYYGISRTTNAISIIAWICKMYVQTARLQAGLEGRNYNYLTEHFRKHFETPVKPKLADANYVFIARKFTMRLVTNKSFARCWYFDLQFSILHGISRCRISTAWKLRERNELRILDGGKEINFQKKNTAIKKIVQFPSFAMIRLIYASIETFSFRKNTILHEYSTSTRSSSSSS